MNLLISILLTTCTVNAMTEACADSQNKEPRFCWGKQLLSQKYCKNVKDLHRWTCIGGSSLGCACKTKFRADDGSCVEERECEDHVREKKTAATLVRTTTEAVPVARNDYRDAAVTRNWTA
ncbi:uncharacterized protein LOC119180076 isoform X1 [Rhipicephalus microplus]|uniref:uncharacterized protein LOC119180076 isoform X1 n=1 Tax=Rhipicephalus microplus TaxID=6941 RepID=UPI003F6D221F